MRIVVELKENLTTHEFWYLLRGVAKKELGPLYHLPVKDHKLDILFPGKPTIGRLTFGVPGWASILRLQPKNEKEITLTWDIPRDRIVKKWLPIMEELITAALKLLEKEGVLVIKDAKEGKKTT